MSFLSKKSFCKNFYVLGVLFSLIIPAFAENWPGYEGNLHQSSSSVEIPPDGLHLKWTRRFNQLVSVVETDPNSATQDIWASYDADGRTNWYMYARNMSLLNGKIALATTTTTNGWGNPGNGNGRVAGVTVLNATNGSVINCVRTTVRIGSYKGMYDTIDTGMGCPVVSWDPDTGFLFLATGGDRPSRVAIDPLANVNLVTPQVAKGAYEDLNTAWPSIRSTRKYWGSYTNTLGLTRAECPNPHKGAPLTSPLSNEQWEMGSMGYPYNASSFFDVQPGSPYILVNKATGHEMAYNEMLVNKYTGLAASQDWNKNYFGSIVGWPVFCQWGGAIASSNQVFYIGPYDPALPPTTNATGTVSKGLFIAGITFTNKNLLSSDGGYTGPGADETAVPTSTNFSYFFSSTGGNYESWHYDNYARNKAMLVEGDGVWMAWKPGTNGTVKLVHATSSASTAYDLSVGNGMRGQDIWPNIAFAKVGSTKYIVYALFNAKISSVAAPVGPSTLTVFDATAGVEKWSYSLNNASSTGNYPSLRPNSFELYSELARMAVAGRYAYVAWVDTSQVGGNLQLKVAAFDVTSATAPSSPPTPFTVDLGVARNPSTTAYVGNLETRVSDIMVVDGMLYLLIDESSDLKRMPHVHAQQIVAIGVDPKVMITSHVDPAYCTNSPVLVQGTAWHNSAVQSVTLNGTPVNTSDGYTNWSLSLGVSPGTNMLTAVASEGVFEATNQVRVIYATGSFDGDGDGVADLVQISDFGLGFNTNPLTVATADFDGDGQSNEKERIAGTSLSNAKSVFAITNSQMQANSDFSFLIPSVAGKTYRALWSTNMLVWNILGADVSGTGAPLTFTDAGAGAQQRRFYKVVIP